MINLLPSKKKAEIRAARTNVALIRYIGILLVALAFILGALYVTYTVLGFTKSSSEQLISSNDVKANVYNSTKAQVDSLSANLSQAKTLLDQEVQYSKVLTNIAQLMPAGTVLGTLNLDTNSFNGTPVTTRVYAKTSANAVTLRQNFQQSRMFSGVSFQTISESGSGVTGYPVSVDMTFTINRTAGK